MNSHIKKIRPSYFSYEKYFFYQILPLILIAGIYAGLSAWTEQAARIYPLDIDGWGILINRLKNYGCNFSLLFREPSLFRGPIVPFLFGLTYYIAPFDGSVLVFNSFAFSLAAGCLFAGFCYLGVNRIAAMSAIFCWIFFSYGYRFIFGYYFAEPTISLLSSLLFLFISRTVLTAGTSTAFFSGGIAGLLLMVRAPFLFVVSGIPIIFWLNLSEARGKIIGLFCSGLLFIFIPWPLRNFLMYGDFIPFTIDGGIVMFQGTYLKGDDDIINNLREIPEFAEVEKTASEKSPIEQDRYWKALAIEQIRRDPLGQLRLCIRKVLRFWLYLPAHSWIPTLKTSIVAIIFLPLACFGVLRGRHFPIVQLCTLWVSGLWLFHGIVHTELRYNFSVMPMMFMLAILGLSFLSQSQFLSEFMVSTQRFLRKRAN